MRLRYSRRAIRQFYRISAHIAQDSPHAAVEVGRRLHEVIVTLSENPRLGRSGVVVGTREFPVPGLPYVIVYRLIQKSDELRIAGIYHGAQLRPGQA
jgi:plasmid stabilization system protein ParE